MTQYIIMETAAVPILIYYTGSEKKQGCVRQLDATLSGRCDSDGLCCELLIKISRVRLRGNLGLKRWDQLLKQSTHGDISVVSNSCPPDDNLQGFPEGIIYSKASSLSPWLHECIWADVTAAWTQNPQKVPKLNLPQLSIINLYNSLKEKKTKVCGYKLGSTVHHLNLAEIEN